MTIPIDMSKWLGKISQGPVPDEELQSPKKKDNQFFHNGLFKCSPLNIYTYEQVDSVAHAGNNENKKNP